ncbi:cation diffusion facilitator family transporter [Thiorhodovibrio frisius]|uniref:Putative Co/Zn/Cd cation transporter n=1 Tax=Thiorhodovibrio frisius TaxID=631362 RepID=H8Z6X4_9GAMM|nr:cation transporter [Thiorhodovibrio frisius]EIC19759.1 putative Co/Zn/Cd cation transporter [Thiorhodovibrio frisius]WPL20271.1 cation diffusion facilitator family transporter [Thiorhodovibrio frisius]
MTSSSAADKPKPPIAVYGAMAANGVIAVAKGVAALFTGSSAMFSECIHSLVDTANEGLLLHGMKRSAHKPDQAHPFGTGNPIWDGIASMMIGLTLASVALILAYESRSLLIGEAADPLVIDSIRQLAREDADVVEAGRPLTMHLGPDEVLLNLDVRFRSGLSSETIMGVVDRLERGIRERHPEIKRIFIEAESLRREGAGAVSGTPPV